MRVGLYTEKCGYQEEMAVRQPRDE